MEKFYWLAVNGASVASSWWPMTESLVVTPTPEQLLGFRTMAEAQKVQQFLLTAPIGLVNKFMTEPDELPKAGMVRYIRPSNPQPPAHGVTSWEDG